MPGRLSALGSWSAILVALSLVGCTTADGSTEPTAVDVPTEVPLPDIDLIAVEGEIPFEGGTCLILSRWTESGWQPEASAVYSDARLGVWDRPAIQFEICDTMLIIDGSLQLPTDLDPGIYSVDDYDTTIVVELPD